MSLQTRQTAKRGEVSPETLGEIPVQESERPAIGHGSDRGRGCDKEFSKGGEGSSTVLVTRSQDVNPQLVIEESLKEIMTMGFKTLRAELKQYVRQEMRQIVAETAGEQVDRIDDTLTKRQKMLGESPRPLAMIAPPSPIMPSPIIDIGDRTSQPTQPDEKRPKPVRAKDLKPKCTRCRKRHWGICYKGMGVCYSCGQAGHERKTCPQVPGSTSQHNQ